MERFVGLPQDGGRGSRVLSCVCTTDRSANPTPVTTQKPHDLQPAEAAALKALWGGRRKVGNGGGGAGGEGRLVVRQRRGRGACPRRPVARRRWRGGPDGAGEELGLALAEARLRPESLLSPSLGVCVAGTAALACGSLSLPFLGNREAPVLATLHPRRRGVRTDACFCHPSRTGWGRGLCPLLPQPQTDPLPSPTSSARPHS